jgi:cytochrome b6-f complex iron-sulfur subunit
MATTSDMNRKEFLQLFGLGATALLATACLGGCSSTNVTPASNVDVTVDLTGASSANLNNASIGYIYISSGQVILAKLVSGSYIALQAPCPHEGVNVIYRKTSDQFVCTKHNSIFANTGARISGQTPSGLKSYTVVQTGTTLRITG